MNNNESVDFICLLKHRPRAVFTIDLLTSSVRTHRLSDKFHEDHPSTSDLATNVDTVRKMIQHVTSVGFKHLWTLTRKQNIDDFSWSFEHRKALRNRWIPHILKKAQIGSSLLLPRNAQEIQLGSFKFSLQHHYWWQNLHLLVGTCLKLYRSLNI